MEKQFLDEKAVSIIEKMTNNPFAIDGHLWFYWLFKLELIPGSWTATFYLEENLETGKTDHVYTGCGTPTSAVKEAYKQIDKTWLKSGFAEGRLLKKQFDKMKRK
jgi:hypothetical protein